VEALRNCELHERLMEGTRTLSELIAVPPVKGAITPAEDYHKFKIAALSVPSFGVCLAQNAITIKNAIHCGRYWRMMQFM